MVNNYTRSIFLESLVPQYIREEYPIFVSFLKSYYDYLDRKAGQFAAVVVEDGGKKIGRAHV